MQVSRNNLKTNKAVNFKSLSQVKFNRIFPVFLANTDEKDRMVRGMRPIFADRLSSKWRSNNLRILDIGCGDGFTASKIYESIHSLAPNKKLSVRAIDNNSDLLKAYRSRFEGQSGFGEIKTEQKDIFSQGNFEDNADLEIISHSLYHAQKENLGTIITSIHDSLKKGGVAVISMLKGDSDFNIIQKRYGHHVTNASETNPVGVTLDDIKKEIASHPKIATKTTFEPYNAYVYFPQKHFGDFEKWQKIAPQKPAPNPEAQKTLDLLEFIVHGDFENLRKNKVLGDFLTTAAYMFGENGHSASGAPRINFNGENIFIKK